MSSIEDLLIVGRNWWMKRLEELSERFAGACVVYGDDEETDGKADPVKRVNGCHLYVDCVGHLYGKDLRWLYLWAHQHNLCVDVNCGANCMTLRHKGDLVCAEELPSVPDVSIIAGACTGPHEYVVGEDGKERCKLCGFNPPETMAHHFMPDCRGDHVAGEPVDGKVFCEKCGVRIYSKDEAHLAPAQPPMECELHDFGEPKDDKVTCTRCGEVFPFRSGWGSGQTPIDPETCPHTFIDTTDPENERCTHCGLIRKRPEEEGEPDK